MWARGAMVFVYTCSVAAADVAFQGCLAIMQPHTLSPWPHPPKEVELLARTEDSGRESQPLPDPGSVQKGLACF